MSLFNLYLNVSDEYKKMLNEIIKYLSILVLFHWLMSTTYNKDVSIFTGDFLNTNFLNIIFFILISLMFHYLVIKKILVIK